MPAATKSRSEVDYKKELPALLTWLTEQGVEQPTRQRIVAQFNASGKASVILDHDLAEKIKPLAADLTLPFSLRFSNEFGDGTDLSIRPK